MASIFLPPERVRDNYHPRASLGAWPGGPAPYGYALSKAEVDGRSVSTLIPDEHAKTVCQIFEEYAKPETSLRGLAKDLTARGIHGPKREAWDNVTLSRILRNPVYVRADEAVYCYYLAQGVQSSQTSEDYDGEHGCVLIGKRSRSGSAQKEEKLRGAVMVVIAHALGGRFAFKLRKRHDDAQHGASHR